MSPTSPGGPSSDLAYGVAPRGHRLPGGTRVGTVRLVVGHLERSLDWYERVLGLSVLERAGDHGPEGHPSVSGRWVALGSPDGRPLVELFEQPGARPVGRRGRLGLFHFALLLPERAALGKFLRHVRDLDEPIGASDHHVSEALYLHDPDGLGVEVYADRPREAWRRQGRELAMTTEPLDLPDLAAAAGDAPWSGMPAGTVVGHVHLHVGDLQEAGRFYHEGLGLDRMVWSYPGALFLAAGGYHHHLAVNSWAAGAPSPTSDDARLLEWELVVPTEDDARRALASVGAESSLAADPWGTVLRIRGEG